MKTRIIPLILLVLTPFTFASANEGESKLPLVIRNHLAKLDEKTQVDSLIEWYYGEGTFGKLYDLEEAMMDEAISIAQRIDYDTGLATAVVASGHIAADAGNYQKADSLYVNAMEIRVLLKDWSGVASCFNNIGRIHKLQSDYRKAIDNYQKGINRIPYESGASQNLVILYNNLGAALEHTDQFEEAISYFETSYRLADSLNLTEDKAMALINMGSILQFRLDEYDRSEEKTLEAVKLFNTLNLPEYQAKCYLLLGNIAFQKEQYPKADSLFELALSFPRIIDNDRAIILRNRGRTALKNGLFSDALSYGKQALGEFERLKNKEGTADALYLLGSIYNQQQQYLNAQLQLEKALLYPISDPQLRSEILLELSNALMLQNDFPNALATKSQFIEIQDSIFSTAAETYKSLLKETEKNGELQVQLEEQKTENLRSQNRRLLYGSIIIGLILWIIIGTLALYAQSNRQKRKIAEQEISIEKQKTIDILQNKVLETMYARQEGVEASRRRIGKELHDGLGAILATIKINLKGIEKRLTNIEEKSQKQYATTNQLIDEAASEVRRISHEMTSSFLEKFGLAAKLRSMVDSINTSEEIKAELHIDGLEERLPDPLEFNIYRIMQELLQNVIRHAKAKTIEIELNKFDAVLNIVVEDDGVGFELDNIQSDGMGLRGLQSRVHFLKGELNIDTQVGKGTSISIDIPIS